MVTSDKSTDKGKQDKSDDHADDGLPNVGTLSEAEADEAERERQEQLQREAERAAEEDTTHYNAHLDADNTDTGTLNAPADVHERHADANHEIHQTAQTREAKSGQQGGTATRS